ncbi:hypothetical protein B484DRAFT_132420 [Ochromonadaceae sp. CCMP2298]|nr:hypothetical protein B484DRAFT_132420 [Ochromonadaceae sp. CCMP2298]
MVGDDELEEGTGGTGGTVEGVFLTGGGGFEDKTEVWFPYSASASASSVPASPPLLLALGQEGEGGWLGGEGWELAGHGWQGVQGGQLEQGGQWDELSTSFCTSFSTDPHPHLRSLGGYIDLEAFRLFRVEGSVRVRAEIEEKVADSRRMVASPDKQPQGSPTQTLPQPTLSHALSFSSLSSLSLSLQSLTPHLPCLRADKVPREPSRDHNWVTIHTIKIQNQIRTFLARRRVRKMRALRRFNNAAHRMESLIRRFLYQARKKTQYWRRRMEAFLMRKQAVRRFKASITLAAFFRGVLEAKRSLAMSSARELLDMGGAIETWAEGVVRCVRGGQPCWWMTGHRTRPLCAPRSRRCTCWARRGRRRLRRGWHLLRGS